ncbi:hypothetical protein BCR33DRAFT_724136 [Rhizoclosmatium globosum]|uniref:HNH nuclease domain-containing protein n=1 Tax=Rhizoclosmatium globosum TaxID=329046 RepID=A0A1Y2B820_9FUNG|nr:hypothetical protein BCR33DRAFT_724136 [Rhizoclosmatium globosum]|eukprot:ORY30904.1 hypothetical protein BCR33DRAFT_724136 [Rhizoclosmatium globosum]
MSERDEVLLKMMLSAEKDYHDTKKDYEGAKHDLTLEWKLVHPNGLVSGLLGYLQANKSLQEMATKTEHTRDIYHDIIRSDFSPLKRKSEASTNTLSKKSRYQSESERSVRSSGKQTQFRKRVMDRDQQKCVCCKLSSGDACHIIPWATYNCNPVLWNTQFGGFCYDRDHNSFDVRNGLFLCFNHHHDFDSFQFTIQYNLGRFFYTTFTKSGLIQGQALEFGEMVAFHPHPKFLDHHNQRFYDYHKMKAASEPNHIQKQESDTTLGNEQAKHKVLDFFEFQEKEEKLKQLQCFMELDAEERSYVLLGLI